MVTPRGQKAPRSGGNGRTIAVAVVALGLGSFVLWKGLPKSSSSSVSTSSGSVTTKAPAKGTATTSTTSTSIATTTTPPTTINVLASKIIVVNGAAVDGIAGRVSKKLTDKGWITISPTNLTPSAAASVVYFNPSFADAANAVAQDLGIKGAAIAMPGTKPVDIKDAQILVVLGTDFAEASIPAGSKAKPGTPATATTGPTTTVAGTTSTTKAGATTTLKPAPAVTTPTTKKP